MDDYHTIKEYYEHQYTKHREKTFPFDYKRYDHWFAQALEKNQTIKKALDVGCGVGYLCAYLHQRGINVSGVDISHEAIKIAQEQVPSGTFLTTNESCRLEFEDQAFDLITCIGVLEHIPHPEKILDESYRVLKKGGRAVFLVPNKLSPYFWFGGTGQVYERPRSIKNWSHLFQAAGFHILNIQKDPGPTFQSTEKFHKKAKIFLLNIINRLSISCTYQFNFLLEK